ncbi:MAG: hypothetical protein WC814_01530 [Candidatus Paceibacterota bacterium]|jgi:hypothetical protein
MAKRIDFPPPPLPRGENDELLSSPDSPEKNRRAFAKIEQGSDEPAVQVETKPGLAWTEPEPSAPAGRERKKPEAPVDAEHLVQVETKEPATVDAKPLVQVETKAAKATDEPAGFDSRIEPTFGAELGEPGEPIQATEMTPGESLTLLSKLIEGYKKTLEVTKNVTEGVLERFTKSKEYLNNRAKEIDAQAETSGLEKAFRVIGEKYNKLNLVHKLGIGVALGVGTAVGSAVSLPLALAGLSGLILQRAAGTAGMFVSIEKKLQEKKVDESFQFMATKERAALDAMLYTFAMSTAINQGLEFVREHHLVEQTREWWLGDKLGHSTAPTGGSGLHQPAAVSNAGEAIAQATTPEVPAVVVHASSGHGYEYMVKRMWEDLQERQLDPSKYAEGSDIRRLLEADASSIDKVVHQIAADPSHGFFNPDGTSAVIRPTDALTVGANGQVLLMTPDDVIAHAPVGGPTTPAYHPSAVEQAPYPDGIVPPDTSPAALEDQEAGTPLETPETESPEAPPPLQEVNVVSPEPIKTVDLTHEQDVADSENAVVHSEAVSEAPTFMTKIDGILIDPRTPAIYQAQLPTGETYLASYGGSYEERLKFIQEYLMRPENQGQTIRIAHEVPSILGPQIKVDEIGASTNAGQTSWILDFFKKPVSPPTPETFLKKLSK